jgi:hypothetical protein
MRYALPALVLSLLVPISASAQWSVSAYLGQTESHGGDIQAIQSPDTDITFADVSFDDRSFDRPLYYGLRGGYMFTPSTGAEVEFIHMKAYARVDDPVLASGRLLGRAITAAMAPNVVLTQYDVSHGLNLLVGNYVRRFQIHPRVDLGLRAGLGLVIAHPEIRAFGEAVDEYQLHGPAVHLAAGVEYEVATRLFLLGEYKFTATQPRFEFDSVAVENKFYTHHITFGFGVRF